MLRLRFRAFGQSFHQTHKPWHASTRFTSILRYVPLPQNALGPLRDPADLLNRGSSLPQKQKSLDLSLAMIRIFTVFSLSLLAISTSIPSSLWPEFRGPTGQGLVSGGEKLPLKWSETENITWKTPIHGRAWSSP